MATREKNLKKINAELEQLDDEELENIAGGEILAPYPYSERPPVVLRPFNPFLSLNDPIPLRPQSNPRDPIEPQIIENSLDLPRTIKHQPNFNPVKSITID